MGSILGQLPQFFFVNHIQVTAGMAVNLHRFSIGLDVHETEVSKGGFHIKWSRSKKPAHSALEKIQPLFRHILHCI